MSEKKKLMVAPDVAKHIRRLQNELKGREAALNQMADELSDTRDVLLARNRQVDGLLAVNDRRRTVGAMKLLVIVSAGAALLLAAGVFAWIATHPERDVVGVWRVSDIDKSEVMKHVDIDRTNGFGVFGAAVGLSMADHLAETVKIEFHDDGTGRSIIFGEHSDFNWAAYRLINGDVLVQTQATGGTEGFFVVSGGKIVSDAITLRREDG